jgi:DNA-binding NarL/FixJ family response regulator
MILEGAKDILIVGEAANGTEAVAKADAFGPDVVLMDIRMPGIDGLAATDALRRRQHAPEVIVLTTFDVDDYVVRALRAGAGGFLLKDTPPQDIVKAIRLVAGGDPMLSPAVTRQLIRHVVDDGGPARRHRARAALETLSERERQVALAIGEGKPNADIARELFMSVATVKAYVSRILGNLDLNNRVQVALLVHDAEFSEPGSADQ